MGDLVDHSWRVRRRWVPASDGRGVRARFDAHRRKRAQRRKHDDDSRWYDHIDDGGCLSLFDGWVVLVLAVAVLVAILLFVFGGPVLLLGIDLVWFVVVFIGGAISRFVFGRPWRVEAIGPQGERRDWHVRGFGDAGRLRHTLQAEFDAGLDPRPEVRA